MTEPGAIEERTEHHSCRRLVWELSPEGETLPSRYCDSPLGVFHALDCPVYQGGACLLFEPRPEGEEPAPRSDDEIDAARARLAEDYLRWPYWRRVASLRRGGEDERVVVGGPEEAEPEEAEPDDVGELVRSEIVEPAEEPEALREKYPGQRRSEDRMRSRRAPPDPAPIEKVLDAEIFEPAPDAEDAAPEPVSEADPPATDEPAPGAEPGKPEDPPAGTPGGGERKKRPSKGGRRRSRRRRRGRGKRKPDGGKG